MKSAGCIQKFLDRFKEKYGFNFTWFIRYAVGGILTTIAEWGVYYILFKPCRVDYLAASIVANLVSYVVNYVLSKYYVFRSPETSHKRDLSLFVLCSGVNLAVVTLLVKLTVGMLGFNDIIGRIISSVVAFVVVFIFKRYIIWANTDKY